MALSPRLDIRQSQQLVLTPQLQQAIKLLQMANLELDGYLQQEIERNPLLESAGATGDPESDNDPVDDGPLSGFDSESEVYDAGAGMSGDGMLEGDAAALDVSYDGNVFDDGPTDAVAPDIGANTGLSGGAGSGASGGGDGASASDVLEQTAHEAADLKTSLTGQMQLLLSDPEDRFVAAHLIDLLDEAGYLRDSPDDLAARLGVETADIKRILQALRTLEPTGVFACDLRDCLALQLAEQDRLDPAMAALLDNLDLLARQDLPALRRACNVDHEDLADMIAEIRRLDPHPGHAFGGESPQTVVPDVLVQRQPAGGWSVELNADTLPRVLVNQQYYAELRGVVRSREDRKYLSQCLADANWLVRALDQRARTILTVSTEILRQQEGFFLEGVRGLRPLTLRDIAETVDMHESTISRVTSGKYLSCARGVFELKYFFTSAIQSTSGGEALSSESVRGRIRNLIDSEAASAILSDDRIVELLRQEGIDIARRTVAKYREAMRIPSSVQRRRAKRMTA